MKIIAALLFTFIGFSSISQNEDVINSFVATEFNGKVLLTFSINSGYTCNGVTILRSLDSVNFTTIGSIEGICGSSQESINYDFTDISPVKNAINYYRLSLGGVGFSWIVSAEVIDMGLNNSLIRPNPISENTELFFDNENKASLIVEIFSSTGLLVHTESTNEEKISLKNSDFDAGTYFYSVHADGVKSNVTGKFVVN
jgi:hypothetical protein